MVYLCACTKEKDSFMRLEVIEKEIVPKGKAYLVLREGSVEGMAEILRELRGKGARQVFLTSKAPETELQVGAPDEVRLAFAHDMLGLTCALTFDRPRPQGRLTLEPLTREKKDLFLDIYNQSFFDVPNSATYDAETFEEIMTPEYHCGFALLDGSPVGIYELGFKKENPEIGSIGLTVEARGKGLGRELLLTVMDNLADLGYKACWLQVSTLNRQAYPLYRSVGFGQDELLGRWYEVTEAHG
ncbi:MAG: GNAT family N-acetyltransferase [Clostridia bacterium]|nr:GNAT family N-acetyltransferase [Clostridia bacterium]